MVMAVVVLATACGGTEPTVVPDRSDRSVQPVSGVHPNRSLVADGGQFLTSCALSHQLNDDPIMHRGHPGMSHPHEFFGNHSTDATSTYASLIGAETTCSDAGDRSAYWVPELVVDQKRVEPKRVDAYYRVAHGVVPADVQPYPDGLEVLAGDMHATTSAPFTVAAWACGGSPEVAAAPPKNCTDDRPVQLRLTFPSCWDGAHTAPGDHRSHMSYPSQDDGCDNEHPVAVPQLTLTVHYPLAGTYSQASLASGGFTTTHGDFLAAWEHKRIADQVSGCLARSVTCGLVGGTFHTGPGAGDNNTYNQRPVAEG